MQILPDIKVIKNFSFQENTRVCIDKNKSISQERIRKVMEPGAPTQERRQGTLQEERVERATFHVGAGASRTPRGVSLKRIS